VFRDRRKVDAARVDLVRAILLFVAGRSAGVVGVIFVSQLATATRNDRQTYLLSIVTAVILDGTSFNGGRGSLLGMLIAMATLGVLQNGFARLQFSSYVRSPVPGVMLSVVVWVDESPRRDEQR
jgi:ribose/xylose/arabinose/galactoside ABC-type transport system permease subunit